MAKFRVSDEHFQIDRNCLDDEWVSQPDLYRRYATAAADAKQAHEEAKNDSSVVRAQVERDIRSDPEKFGIGKVTEGAIKTAIEVDDRCREAGEAEIEARHRYDVLSAAVGALDHKRSALSNLVQLHSADYFSQPTAPASSREPIEEAGKQRARRSQRRRADDDDD